MHPRLSLSVCRFQLDLADLQKELDKSQSVFPENPSVWVKDLASYLNYKLQAPRSDPMLSQHPHGQWRLAGPAAGGAPLWAFALEWLCASQRRAEPQGRRFSAAGPAQCGP